MFKSTITLPNGSVAQVESGTVDQLIKVLASNLGEINAIEVVNQSESQKGFVPPKQTLEKHLVSGTNSIRNNYFTADITPWSKRDILLIANKLAETKAQHGTIGDTVKYVQQNADHKRKPWATYVMVNRIKRYMFDGKVRGIGLQRSAVKILQEAGIQAGAMTQKRLVAPAAPKKRKGRENVRWTEKDIISMGKIVRDNIHLRRGLTKLVRNYIKTEADNKNRTNHTLETTVSDIKLYFTGKNPDRIAGKMQEILEKNGILPVGQSVPVSINRISAPEEA